MISTFARASVPLSVIIFAAGCASGTLLTPVAPQGGEPFAVTADRLTQTQSSPCKIPNGLYFRGPCQRFALPRYGKRISFASYRGLSVVEHIGSNSGDTSLVVGMGTSDKDITGKTHGSAFPEYGSVRCMTAFGGSIPCKGKAFLYSLTYNTGVDVGLHETPTFRVTSTDAFPGKKCQEAFLGYSTSGFFWIDFDIYAKPKNGSVTFWQSKANLITLGHDYVGIFAFHCF